MRRHIQGRGHFRDGNIAQTKMHRAALHAGLFAFSPFLAGGRAAVITGRFSVPFFALPGGGSGMLCSQLSTWASPAKLPPNNLPLQLRQLDLLIGHRVIGS